MAFTRGEKNKKKKKRRLVLGKSEPRAYSNPETPSKSSGIETRLLVLGAFTSGIEQIEPETEMKRPGEIALCISGRPKSVFDDCDKLFKRN